MQRPPANWPTRYWPWSSVEDKSRTFPTAIIAEPFPGSAPPFGSKDEDSDDDEDSEEAEASFYAWGCDTDTDDPHEHPAAVDHSEDGEARDNSFPETRYPHDRVGGGFAAAGFMSVCWRTTAAHLRDLTLSSPDTAVTPDGRTVSLRWLAINSDDCLVGNCVGFMTNVLRSAIAGQPGITSPVSKLPPAPPGASEKAKERSKLGRGVEGDGDDGIDPMSTLDKFNWDNFPLPGLGQI